MEYKIKEYCIAYQSIRNLLEIAYLTLPKEASGLLISERKKHSALLSLFCTKNTENTTVSFRIHDEIIKEVQRKIFSTGKSICGCFHTHPFGPARPSKYDCAGKKTEGELWLIYSVRYNELKLFEWIGTGFLRRRFKILK